MLEYEVSCMLYIVIYDSRINSSYEIQSRLRNGCPPCRPEPQRRTSPRLITLLVKAGEVLRCGSGRQGNAIENRSGAPVWDVVAYALEGASANRPVAGQVGCFGVCNGMGYMVRTFPCTNRPASTHIGQLRLLRGQPDGDCHMLTVPAIRSRNSAPSSRLVRTA